jgi:hypothetical protein
MELNGRRTSGCTANLNVSERNTITEAGPERLRYGFLRCELACYVREAINSVWNARALDIRKTLVKEVFLGV